MKTLLKQLYGLLLFMTAFGLAQPGITVSPVSFDFGRVPVGGDSAISMTIRNTGTSNLSIADIQPLGTDDANFIVEDAPPYPLILEPDSTRLLNIRFQPDAERAFNATLVILSDDPNMPTLQLPLTGLGVFPQIQVTPGALNIGDVQVGDAGELQISISNIGQGLLRITDVEVLTDPGGLFTFEGPLTPYVIKPDSVVTYQVFFRPDTAGPKMARLAIQNNDPDASDQLILINLNGNGINAAITAEPSQVDFGGVFVNRDSVRVLTFKNRGTAVLLIDAFTISGSNPGAFDILESPPLPIELQPNVDSAVVQLRFQPKQRGVRSAMLNVFSNDSLNHPLEVPLLGEGVAPIITLSRPLLNFGDVLTGRTREDSIAVTNNGNAALVISDIDIAGQDSSVFGIVRLPDFPLTLNPGIDTLRLPLSFSPASTGSQTAEVRIFNNDPDSPIRTLNLTGRGVEPLIAVSADTLDFGAVRLGTLVESDILITNPGTANMTVSDTNFVSIPADVFDVSVLSALPSTLIPGNDTLVVRVRFQPDSLKTRAAQLQFVSNAFNQSMYDVVIQGEGGLPVIALETDTLNFGEVSINDTTVAAAMIRNDGKIALNIQGLVLNATPGPSMAFDSLPALPITVPPNATISIPIQFFPKQDASYSGTLQLFSDDPGRPSITLPLAGRGVVALIAVDPEPVDFGIAVVGQPLTRTVMVTNSGSALLRIDSLRFSGQDADFFDSSHPLPDTLLPGAEQMIPVRLNPKSTGRQSAQLEIYSNANNAAVIPVMLQSRSVNPPALVNFTTGDAILNQAVRVEVSATADTTLQTVVMSYFTPSGGLPQSNAMADLGSGQFEGSIAAGDVTNQGVVITVTVTDDFNFSVSDTLFRGVLMPPGSVNNSFAAARINRWQMFSVPYEGVDEAQRSIRSVLANLGEESENTWKIYRTDSSGFSVNYFNVEQLDELDRYGRFEPGNAFWIYLREDEGGSVPTRTIALPESRSLPASPFVYALQPGWNQVGNPYPFPISWDQVTSPQKAALSLYQWDGQAWDSLSTAMGWMPLLRQSFTLTPWGGYSIHNPTGAVVELTFNPLQSGSGTALEKQEADGAWQLQLVAENDAAYDVNILGMHPSARDAQDHLDVRNPAPVARQYVSVNFQRPAWQAPVSDFASDIRSVDAEGGQWYFDVTGTSRQATFYLQGIDGLPQGFQVRLVDRKYRRQVDLRAGETIVLGDLDTADSDRFVMLVGAPAYLDQAASGIEMLSPKHFALLNNYPNPFNPETHIRYQLAADGKVQLTVFNLLGQTVLQLVNAFQAAGYYEVRWDGRDMNGRETASGLYLYRLQYNDVSASGKMIKLK